MISIYKNISIIDSIEIEITKIYKSGTYFFEDCTIYEDLVNRYKGNSEAIKYCIDRFKLKRSKLSAKLILGLLDYKISKFDEYKSIKYFCNIADAKIRIYKFQKICQ